MVSRKFRASPVKVTGITPDDVPFESSVEEDLFFLLRFDVRTIASYDRPDKPVIWRDKSGKSREYTPDVVIHYRTTRAYPSGRTVLGEVKPDFEDTDSPKSRLSFKETDEERAMKWAAATNFALLNGWEFKVFRDADIRTPRLRNVKFLIRHLDRPATAAACSRVLRALRRFGPTPMNRLMYEIEPDLMKRAALYPALYTCMVDCRIDVDLDVLLKNDTVVSVAA